MANIWVKYEELPTKAKSMREIGKQLNAELVKAYKSVDDMHAAWYGNRYNDLVKEFNAMIPQLNEVLNLLVGEIPFALETVANNYSQADKGSNVTSAVKEPPTRINEIAVRNDTGMKFETSNVANIQSSVSANFRNAREQMNNFASQYSQIEWKSDASARFTETFNRLKTNISASFENIEREFVRLMEKTQEDIQATESANTIK